MTTVLSQPLPPVDPGKQVDISIEQTAPAEPGVYFGDWRFQDDQGNFFGEVIFLRIVVVPPAAMGTSNSRYKADVTVPDGSALEPGKPFVKTWRVENTGERAWSNGYHLVHVDGTAMTPKTSQPLSFAQPGEQVNASVSLTAPAGPGAYRSDWRMQDDQGNLFGDLLYLEINVLPAGRAEWPFRPELWRDTIWAITSVFESGRPQGNPAAYQTFDAGIVSYGKHQATLAAGSLGQVLEAFFKRSNSPISDSLRREYAERVRQSDPNLRHDRRLRELLLQAAAEEAMSAAQDEVFDRSYYQPAIQQARKRGISTPLGLACLYDTHIQGGLSFDLESTRRKLGGIAGPAGAVDEAAWLKTFLDEREARLLRLADRFTERGDPKNAEALRISTFRVKELRKLLETGNLGLEGEFFVRGRRIGGIVH